MGTVFSKVWDLFVGARKYKLVVVGLNNAGKTSILYGLQLGKFVPTQPTIGGNVEEITHHNLQFLVWDLGGQEQLREAWSLYYARTDAVVLVVDSTAPERLPTAKAELGKMLAHPDLASAVLLVFANKQDLPGAMSAEAVAAALELPRVTRHSWHIQPCSARTQEGLHEGLSWVASKVKEM